MSRRLVAVTAILLVLCALGLAPEASGQGFLVKPMILEIAVRPGSSVGQAIEVRNTEDRTASVRLSTWLLTQGGNGAWQAVARERAPSDPALAAASCIDWLRLPVTETTIGPLDSARFDLEVFVPLDAAGTHCAALLVESVPRESPGGLALVVRFLIPVLVEVRGPSVQRKVECLDARLEHRDAPGNPGRARSGARGAAADGASNEPAGGPAGGAAVVLDLANEGQTTALLGGGVSIFYQRGGQRWVPVTESAIEETRMIPGARFPMRIDLDRRLPGGTYRVDAQVTIDGQPIRPLRRELQFAGDPGATILPEDVGLRLTPARIEVEGLAGAARRAVLTLENPSTEPLEVLCALERPAALGGVRLGQTTGDEFSCHDWTSVTPESLQIPGGGQRRLTLQLQYPREGALKPCSFATLTLAARYADGQSAGRAEATIIARDSRQEATLRLQPAGLSVARAGASRYAVVASYANTGDAPLDPGCLAHVASGSGARSIRSFALARRPGLILPLETVRFSGEFDAGAVEPGLYVVTAAADVEGQAVEQSLPVRVSDNGGGRVVEVVRGTP